jgi:uncharacterized membrane protein YfcA
VCPSNSCAAGPLNFEALDNPEEHRRFTLEESILEGWEYLFLGVAAVAAGLVNALAGGGTLITFAALTAVGMSALGAVVTSTVALCPGYFGAAVSQRSDLVGQDRRLWLAIPPAILGGLAGGYLLSRTGKEAFEVLVPLLILLASGLLAVQDPLRRWIQRRSGRGGSQSRTMLPFAVGAAAVYGGYFGAGLSVIVLAVVGVLLEDTLTRLNALKQTISLGANVAAASFFILSAEVDWTAAAIVGVGALCGGIAGGMLAGRVDPSMLRRLVVTIGVVVALIYFVR